MSAPGVLVEFAARPGVTTSPDGDFVFRRAPVIFRAGRYEFQDAPPFEMTPEDIRAAAERFEPVPLHDTHRSDGSIFHGKLGELVAAEPSADGAVFGGTVRVPKWLDDLFRGVALPLSATWDRVTKRLKNVALLTNPRIEDARLEAAFAAAHSEVTTMPATTAPDTAGVQPAPAVQTTSHQPDLAARLAEMEKREAAWKAEREELKRQADRTAAAFAAERDKRLLAEAAKFGDAPGLGKDLRDLLAEGYFSLAADDREHGEATFSREGAEPRKGARLDWLRRLAEKVRALPTVLDKDAYRGGAEFANDAGDDPDGLKQVDAAVDAEIERQRKARPRDNGRGA